ncbi:MAG: RNA polymerase sigma factor, partial [Planctomycetota bacterium]
MDHPGKHAWAAGAKGRDLRADWQAIVQGDEAEFAELVDEVTPALAKLCHRMLGWKADAVDLEDLLQETFAKVWSQRRSFRGDSAVQTWITSIALNVCRAQIRRRQRWERWQRFWRPAADSTPQEADERWPPLVRAIEQLPPLLKEVIVLHYLEHQT